MLSYNSVVAYAVDSIVVVAGVDIDITSNLVKVDVSVVVLTYNLVVRSDVGSIAVTAN